MTLRKIGFVGLGVMGRAMASNLMKAGFDLTVSNRSKTSAEITTAPNTAATIGFGER